MPATIAANLSAPQREAILELGNRGSGGNFDQTAMSHLFTLGLVEIRSEDRRLMLTASGREVFNLLRNRPGE